MIANRCTSIASRLLRPTVILATACLGLYAFARLTSGSKPLSKTTVSTRASASVHKEEHANESPLPYPSSVFPGARLVDSPYGVIKVFEWGPETGEKVLLLHGIGTPCIALGNMANELVRNGHRVMLFDFFGRGYSDAPRDIPYDDRLYTSQILIVLASSQLSWTGPDAFHLMGYSLGGAIAAAFAAYHSHLLRSVTLICPGGLIRRHHVGWESRLLYSQGLLPECLLSWLVRRRLEPSMGGGLHVSDGVDTDVDFDDVPVSTERPGVKVGHVIGWQLIANPGFVMAYRSTMCSAPIYGQHEGVWKRLSEQLSLRRRPAHAHSSTIPPGLPSGRICLILAEKDSIVVKDEWIEDSHAVLGSDAVDVRVMRGGHEIAIAKGAEVAQVAMDAWHTNYTINRL